MNNVILYLLVLIVPIIASININSTYAKYKNVKNKKSLTGFDVARKILDENGLNDMYIVEVRGNLTDHYDPTKKVVRLSSDVFHGETIAAIAVAAHECGHAVQDKENYNWFKLRTALCPIINIMTYSAYIVFFVSLLLQMADALMLAIALVFFSLIFQVVTLPVEFDASKRGIKSLKDYDLVENNEKDETEKVLKAAALTYVAAVISSILNLLRLIMIMNDRRD